MHFISYGPRGRCPRLRRPHSGADLIRESTPSFGIDALTRHF